MELPLDFSPFSLDWTLTTKDLGEEVSRLDFFLNSLYNNAQTTLSNYKVSVAVRLMEETTWPQDSGKVYEISIALSSSSILLPY